MGLLQGLNEAAHERGSARAWAAAARSAGSFPGRTGLWQVRLTRPARHRSPRVPSCGRAL